MKKLILIPILLLSVACKKKPVMAEEGSVNILSNIYYDASKSLDHMQFYHVAQMNFRKDTILEMVPDLDNPFNIRRVNVIVDTLYYKMGTMEQAKRTLISDIIKTRPGSVYNKPMGAVYTKEPIALYAKRKEMTDTVLFKKPFHRFRIEDGGSFSIYYVYPTDTLYPYSLNRKIEQDYGGRLERIDSYIKQKDIFVTMQFVNSKKLDPAAKEIFNLYKYK